MCLMSLWNVRLRNICRSKAVFGWFAVLCLFALPVQAQIVLTDSQGTHTFAEVPQRVVVLNWDLLEQVLELGIQPLRAGIEFLRAVGCATRGAKFGARYWHPY